MPPRHTDPRPGRTALGVILALLLIAGVAWLAFSAASPDDDLAVNETTTYTGTSGVSSTEDLERTTTSSTTVDTETPLAADQPGDTGTMDDELGTTGAADDQIGATGTTGTTDDQLGATGTTGTTDDQLGSTGTTATSDGQLGATTGDQVGSAGTSEAMGGETDVTAGSELALGTLEQDPERYIGQTITTTATVAQVEEGSGFWVESGGDRILAVLSGTLQGSLTQALQEGQQVRLTARVVDADRATQVPELSGALQQDQTLLVGEQAVLQVNDLEVLEESATR